MAFITINYNDEEKIYKSVELHTNKGENVFSTGNFVKDWFDALKYFIVGCHDEPLGFSSTIDHFIFDGFPFRSAYLMYDDESKPYLSYQYTKSGFEFFVPENTTPTWEELKEMCK